MLFDVLLASTCLFLDVDGSLLDIAPRPEAVVVPPRLKQDLTTVSRLLGGALALVSGRTVAQLDGLFAPLHLPASGVHGAEWRRAPEGAVENTSGAIPRPVWGEIERILAAFPGTFAEDKVFSFAVHYRAAPEAAEPLQAALAAVVARHAPAGLRLLPGHFVYELKGADFDKGTAVRRFLREHPFAGRQPVFVGDDVTDRPGFAAAIEAGGRAFAVSAEIPGTSGTFANPYAVRQWLAGVAATEHVSA